MRLEFLWQDSTDSPLPVSHMSGGTHGKILEGGRKRWRGWGGLVGAQRRALGTALGWIWREVGMNGSLLRLIWEEKWGLAWGISDEKILGYHITLQWERAGPPQSESLQWLICLTVGKEEQIGPKLYDTTGMARCLLSPRKNSTPINSDMFLTHRGINMAHVTARRVGY